MNYKIIDEYIGSIIKRTRKSKRYTVIEMAKLIDVSRQGYYDYESGKASMPSDKCAKVCNYLGINYIELMSESLDYAKKMLEKEVK